MTHPMDIEQAGQVIWFDNIMEWQDAINKLKSYNINTDTFILMKKQMSDDAGIGIQDSETYVLARMIL